MLKKKIAKTLLAAMVATSAITPLYINTGISFAAETGAVKKALKIEYIEKSMMGEHYSVRLKEENEDVYKPSKAADRIVEVRVNDTVLAQSNSKSAPPSKGSWAKGSSGMLLINANFEKGDKLKLQTEDEIYTLTIDNPNVLTFSNDKIADVTKVVVTPIKNDESSEGSANPETPAAPKEDINVENFYTKNMSGYATLQGHITPVAAGKKVDKVTFTPKDSNQAMPLSKVNTSFGIYGNEFYIDGDGNFVISEKYVEKTNPSNPYRTDKIADGTYTFMSGDQVLGAFSYNPTEKTFTKVENAEKPEIRQYYTILHGTFEDAHTKQKKYDAVSGASLSVTENKNSDVTAYTTSDKAVYDSYIQNPKSFNKEQWKILRDAGAYKTADKVQVHITEGCGMKPVYGLTDSKITLNSKDTATGLVGPAGNYEVWLTFEDVNGNTVTTNRLPFIVHDYENTTLAERIANANPRVMQDGKKIWDITPWAIDKFGGTNNTVTIPSDWKAIYGSHESGTYGVLGHDVAEGQPTDQTLIIGADTNMTLVNMDIRSGVKIIVENGGVLSLKHSVVGGQIIVRNGGVFSMNYDPYHKKPETGSSIQGQVIVEDGGILRDSVIVSNSNFLHNDNKARQNEGPVVKVTGNGVVEGNVFIRGDESATGNNSEGTDILSGQPALEVVEGAKLDIREGATLIANGGGQYITTSKGGNAAIVNGTVEGDGTFVAVAGKSGINRDGTAGVAGTGNIATKKALIHGGITRSGKHKGGKAIADTIKVAETTKASLKDGVVDTKETEGIEPLLLGFSASGEDVTKHFADTAKKVDEELKKAEAENTGTGSDSNPNPNPSPEPNPNASTDTTENNADSTDNNKSKTIDLKDEKTKVNVNATISEIEENPSLFSEEKGFDALTDEEKTALINATYNGAKVFDISKKDIAKFFEVHLRRNGQKVSIKGNYNVALPCVTKGNDFYAVHLRHDEDGKIVADVQKVEKDKSNYVTFKGAESFSAFAVIPVANAASASKVEDNAKNNSTQENAGKAGKTEITKKVEQTSKPATGDSENSLIYLTTVVISGLLALFVRKKKENR